MRYIAEKYIIETARPAEKPSRTVVAVMISGISSMLLYGLLYYFNADILELAKATIHGEKGLFFLPILIAFVFSFVHGMFTSHFWEALGLKAKA